MKPEVSLLFALFIVLSGTISHHASAQSEASIEGLGCLPARYCSSSPLDLSADGRVVVGSSYEAAFRWEDGVISEVVAPGYSHSQKWAYSTSRYGRVIVGRGLDEGFVWQHGQFDSISSGRRNEVSALMGVSDDGRVSVGFRSSRAIRREDGDEILLGDLPGGSALSLAYDVSADGQVIAGRVSSARGFEAFRWEDGMMAGLGSETRANGVGDLVHISPDGSTLIGWGHSERSGPRGFRWRNGVIDGIEALPGGVIAQPFASDKTGDLIVGRAGSVEELRAFIWDDVHGTRLLTDFLEDEYNFSTDGWALHSATAITPNGRTIVGNGTNPNGELEGWIIRLPQELIEVEIDLAPFGREHSGPDLVLLKTRYIIVAVLGSEAFDVLDVDVETLAFGPTWAAPVHKNGGHLADVNDDSFTDLLSHYRTQETGIAAGDTEACVVGETLDGTLFEGCNEILVLSGCGLGFELALLLPGLMWLRKRRRSS